MSDYSSVAPPQSQQNFSQSSAFAAALQRAKQIAAKIHPGSQQQGTKRSLEDGPENMYLEPDNKKFSGGGDFGNAQGPGMTPAAMQAAAQAAAVAARLSVNPNATVNEEIKIPDKMVGLIIGRGGEQITRLQADSGCKIQMAADSGGGPERMCSLSGPREAVNRAREMIQKIVSQHGNGSIEVVSHTTLPSLGSSNSSYGSGGDRSAGGGGGGSGGGYPAYQEMMIPGSKVGLVIGKGGETIKMLQEKTGAKMIVIQDGPGQELEKPLRISGDPQKVEHAKQLVYELIQEKEAFQNRGGFNHGAGGSGGGGGGIGGGGGMMNPGNNEQMEVFVPKVAVGVVIGKGGDMIKKIQGETGCKLQFIQGRGDSPGDRRCYIQGSKQQVDDAKRMIDDLIENVMRRENGERGMNRNGGGGGGGGGGNFGEYGKPMREEVSFVVPASKCGIIIGRGGDTIKQINQQSGAHCEMDRKAQNNNSEKTFIIRGNPDQIEHARSIISEKIGLEILINSSSGGAGGQNYPGMQGSAGNTGYPQQWGYTPQSWDQQQQQQQAPVQINPSTGQPDYSQQWIEYYRSMGLHREADIIEQQQKAKQQAVQAQQTLVPGTAAPNGGPVQAQSALATVQTQQMQQAAGGQPDYSAQWAEYYRSIGKIDEAEAIENQIKAAKAGMASSTASSGGLPGYNLPSGGANAGSQNIVAAAGGFTPNSTQYPQFYGGANPAQPTAYPQGYPAGPYAAYPAAAAAAAARGGSGLPTPAGVPTPTPQPSSAEGSKK